MENCNKETKSEVNKEYFIIKLLYFIRFLGDSFFYTFYPVYLANVAGLDKTHLGIITALTPLLALLLNPFWNLAGRNINRNRQIMKIMTLLEAIAVIFYAKVTGFTLIVILTCTFAAFNQPFYSYLDGFSGTFAEKHNKKYARIRMMGTLAYVFGVFFGGMLIDFIGYDWVFFMAGISFIIVSVLLFFVHPIKIEEKKEEKKTNFKAVLSNKTFYIYLIFYVLSVSMSSIGDSFFGVYLTEQRGLTTAQYGYIHSGAIIIEFLTMLIISTFGSKVKDVYLLLFAGVTYSIRLLGIGLDLPIAFLIPIALLRGLSWGTILAINVKYLIRILGVENLTAGLFIISLINSFICALGNVVCGALIENCGYSSVFISLAAIVLFATILFTIYNYFYFKNKNDNINKLANNL